MASLYYGMLVVAMAIFVLAVYNLVITRLCAHHQRRRRSQREMIRTLEAMSSRSFDNPKTHLVASFRFKKDQGLDRNQDQGNQYDCPICLSMFEEDEEVRRLPRCKHCFHAPCIDMWLYSHFDCPVCRSPVQPPVLRRYTVTGQSQNSQERLPDEANPV